MFRILCLLLCLTLIGCGQQGENPVKDTAPAAPDNPSVGVDWKVKNLTIEFISETRHHFDVWVEWDADGHQTMKRKVRLPK